MTAQTQQRHIICMKWGTKYGPEYVNRLYAMVRRHLTGHFNMVCLTDDNTGIRSEVQCLPIPPLDLPLGIPERGWTKLASFAQDLHGLRGTALFLDVDVVVVGSLDGFFEVPGEFMIIHDYKRPWRITGNSSVYRYELGAHPDGGAITIMPGKYGPYVKWAKINATIPKTIDPEALTLEDALALIVEKAGKAPAKKPARKAAAPKAAGKPKAAAKPKTAVKKAAVKKVVVKKPAAKAVEG